ncbi:MAG: hypothetical protein ABIH68_00625 [bacterium]
MAKNKNGVSSIFSRSNLLKKSELTPFFCAVETVPANWYKNMMPEKTQKPFYDGL